PDRQVQGTRGESIAFRYSARSSSDHFCNFLSTPKNRAGRALQGFALFSLLPPDPNVIVFYAHVKYIKPFYIN
ncbi:hypothetical protein, partial [Edwardsiella anguillarum]